MGSHTAQNSQDQIGHGLPLFSDDKNRTELQAILEYKIVDAPQELRLPKGPEKDEVDFAVTISAGLKWSLIPDRPITICTAFTPFCAFGEDNNIEPDSFEDLSSHLLLRSIAHPSSTLLGQCPGYYRMCWRGPRTGQEWRECGYRFITIPAQSSGNTLTIKRNINARTLDITSRGANAPLVGDEYELIMQKPRSLLHLLWWNWGDIEGDLGKKLLTTWPSPTISIGSENLPEKAVLPFDAWKEDADDDGNTFIWLDIEWDETPKKVRIIE